MTQIRLNLKTTDGKSVYVLELDYMRFKEAGAEGDSKQMLAHVSELLLRRFRLSDATRQELESKLAELRENRHSVSLTVYVEPHEEPRQQAPPSSCPNCNRYRAERDQARAELKAARKERDQAQKLFGQAKELQTKLTKQVAECNARMSLLKEENERLKAAIQVYQEEAQKMANSVKDYRDQLLQCQERLKEATAASIVPPSSRKTLYDDGFGLRLPLTTTPSPLEGESDLGIGSKQDDDAA